MNSRYREESIDAIDPLETMPPAKKSMVIFSWWIPPRVWRDQSWIR